MMEVIADFISTYETWVASFVLFGLFFLFLFMGVPISIGIALSSVITALVLMPAQSAVMTASQKLFSGIDSFVLSAVAFFILAGNIMNQGGVADRLINLSQKLVGIFPGALAHINIVANMMFGCVSGSSIAAAATMGGVMAPKQREQGYDPNYSAAVNIASAPTGILIPPSGPLILFALVSGGTSISALFLAGYLPGALMGGSIMLVALYLGIVKKYPVSTRFSLFWVMGFSFFVATIAPRYSLVNIFVITAISINTIFLSRIMQKLYRPLYALTIIFSNLAFIAIGIFFIIKKILLVDIYFSITTKAVILFIGAFILAFIFACFTKAHKKQQLRNNLRYIWEIIEALPCLVMIIVVIGGIIGGFFTATEGAAIASILSFILAVIYSLLDRYIYKSKSERIYKSDKEALKKAITDFSFVIYNSAIVAATILFLIAASGIMSWVMAYASIPETISQFLLQFNNPILIFFIMNVTLLIVGTFMDLTPAVLIFTPIFLPIATSLGMEPVHFGIMIIFNLGIGNMTPPVGSVLFVGCAVGKVTIESVTKPLLPFFAVTAINLLLITYISDISLIIPRFAGALY